MSRIQSLSRRRRTRSALVGAALLASMFGPASEVRAAGDGAREEGLPSVAEKTAGLEAGEGFLTVHLDRERGRLWLELEPPGDEGVVRELIYVHGLRQGLGSNPIGLDRGQLGEARRVFVRRLGPKVLFEVRNVAFLADTDDVAEARAARDSFATSVLWGGEIGALDPDGRALVDVTSFFVRDAHGVERALAAAEEGTFRLDPERSALDPDSVLVFPRNLEVEAVLTFGAGIGDGAGPGPEVRSVVPVPESATVVQHHSLIELPEPGYRPREFDPRIGMFAVETVDMAAPLTESLLRRWIVRHRLEKTDPEAERSPVVEPIVYYVDPGAPEPIRSALIDGASWWAEAFDAAGYEDAFRVELLPDGAHPLDVRYNVIQWVHRATRGWSYGGGIIDPLTGEMLKGHVSLGSLRIRQDILLFEGLLGVEETGTGSDRDPVELALARIRQLSAHEVGHTLGITHNFAASTWGGRASVMDYPAPWIRPTDDGLDVSSAYGVGLGAWDVHTVRYGYSEPGPGTSEADHLEAIVREGLDDGRLFLADADARPSGAADPRANLWDNGADPVEALEEVLAVRRRAIDGFTERNVPTGQPLAALEEIFVPVYFHHRYQLDAAAKVLAGVETSYAVRGDGQTPARIVDGARQRAALDVILGILDPVELDVPESVLEVLAPRPYHWSRTREQVASDTLPMFDAVGVAETAARQVAEVVLEPTRLARLIDQSRRRDDVPTVEEVLDRLAGAAFGGAGTTGRQAEVARAVERAVLSRWLEVLASDAPRRVAHRLEHRVRRLAESWTEPPAEPAWAAHRVGLRGEVERWLERRPVGHTVPALAPPLPPGSPIGSPIGTHACSLGGGR